MKRLLVFSLMVFLFFGIADAKKKSDGLSVSASMSVYDPPGDAGSTLLFEVAARYKLSNKLTSELSVGWTTYESGGENVKYMPIQLNLEYHPLGQSLFDPYTGGGVSANLQQIGETTTATAGVQAFAGISFKPTSTFSFSAEVKYILTDITDASSGGFSFGGGVEGDLEMNL